LILQSNCCLRGTQCGNSNCSRTFWSSFRNFIRQRDQNFRNFATKSFQSQFSRKQSELKKPGFARLVVSYQSPCRLWVLVKHEKNNSESGDVATFALFAISITFSPFVIDITNSYAKGLVKKSDPVGKLHALESARKSTKKKFLPSHNFLYTSGVTLFTPLPGDLQCRPESSMSRRLSMCEMYEESSTKSDASHEGADKCWCVVSRSITRKLGKRHAWRRPVSAWGWLPGPRVTVSLSAPSKPTSNIEHFSPLKDPSWWLHSEPCPWHALVWQARKLPGLLLLINFKLATPNHWVVSFACPLVTRDASSFGKCHARVTSGGSKNTSCDTSRTLWMILNELACIFVSELLLIFANAVLCLKYSLHPLHRDWILVLTVHGGRCCAMPAASKWVRQCACARGVRSGKIAVYLFRDFSKNLSQLCGVEAAGPRFECSCRHGRRDENPTKTCV